MKAVRKTKLGFWVLFCLFMSSAQAQVFDNAIAGLNQLQTQLVVFGGVIGVTAFTIGAGGKTAGFEWGQRLMVGALAGVILVGAAVTIVGLFTAGAGA